MTDPRTIHAEVYEGKDGWRWRIVAANGRILADSGEAYEHLEDCKHGLELCRGPRMPLFVDGVETGTV